MDTCSSIHHSILEHSWCVGESKPKRTKLPGLDIHTGLAACNSFIQHQHEVEVGAIKLEA